MSTPNLPSRPPVVAVLGHVDHGKTTLLDAIRKTDVASREHGGITQAIGAFSTHSITFIDTPGHEAFTKMRSRGVNAADIAILVVASDDGVMPQTKESIAHIKTAAIPYIVALTKSDLPEVKAERVKQQLLKEKVALEGMGGDVPVVSVSSKTGKGIPELLEIILLVAQITDIKGDPSAPFEGVIIEAAKDRRKGPLATVIVRNGTLSVGDPVIAEAIPGKIRALITDTGANVRKALPGTPIEVLGFEDVPPVGAAVTLWKTEDRRQKTEDTQEVSTQKRTDIESEKPSLPIILRADSQGSLEAIKESLPKVGVRILFAGSGDPGEADVLLAKGANAIIIGFNVSTPPSVEKLAETEGVVIKIYKLIYKLLEELEEAIALFQEGAGTAQEFILGKAKILAVFPYEKKKVAGCKVVEGRFMRSDKVKVLRGEEVLGEARIVSLRRGKEDITKAERLTECGILLSAPLDFEPEDMILSVR